MEMIASTPLAYQTSRDKLGKDFSKENPFSTIYTTYMLIGSPQVDTEGNYMPKTDMDKRDLSFGMYAYQEAFNNKKYFPNGDVQILAMSKKVSENVILSQIYSDMLLCVACLGFIWIYVTIHLKSLFLSSVSMLNIALSIPMGLVFYKIFLKIPFFSLLHILVVLFVLGIGADNTFLFNDTW